MFLFYFFYQLIIYTSKIDNILSINLYILGLGVYP